MDFSTNIAYMRSRLGYPLPDAPSDPQLLQILIDETMNINAELNNSQSHWSIDFWPLTVNAGTEDYQISAANFGRPVYVYTTDSSDTYHTRREIPMMILQDVDRAYNGPQQSGQTTDHSAVTMVFYRQFENWMVRVVPIPGGQVNYNIAFEATYEYGAPGDVGSLTAFHHLLRSRVMLAALPLCGWRGITLLDTPDAWQLKTSALRESFVAEEARFARQFVLYRSQASREGVTPKRPWGAEQDDGWGIGVGRMTNGWGW